MIGVVDTHILVWYVEQKSSLPRKVYDFLDNEENQLVIPSIVLCEIKYLAEKKRLKISFDDLLKHLQSDNRVTIAALNEAIIDKLPTKLEIHDAIIVATCLHSAEVFRGNVVLLTKDGEIKNSKLVEVYYA